jgi:hypothetical protein
MQTGTADGLRNRVLEGSIPSRGTTALVVKQVKASLLNREDFLGSNPSWSTFRE